MLNLCAIKFIPILTEKLSDSYSGLIESDELEIRMAEICLAIDSILRMERIAHSYGGLAACGKTKQ